MQPNKKCLQCGKCCKAMSFYINPLPSIVEYYEKRGCEVRGNVVHIPTVCQHLNLDTNLCRIQGAKPLVCSAFGTVTTENYYIPEGCGYADKENEKAPGRSDGTVGPTKTKDGSGDHGEQSQEGHPGIPEQTEE